MGKVVKVPSIKTINKKRKQFVGVSTFSGGGGSCTGHKMAGIDIQYANEFIPAAVETYQANHSNFVDPSDIRTVKGKDILKRLGLKRGQLPFFDGSPPCASFSTAGTRNAGWGNEKKYSDSAQITDDLFFEYSRLVDEMEPWVFVAENVTGLIKGVAKGYFKDIHKHLSECGRKGYKVICYKIRASYLDVPQARERMIFVGVRNDLVDKVGVGPVAPRKSTEQARVWDYLPHIAMIKSKKGSVIMYVSSQRPCPTITASDSTTSPTAQFSCGGFVETTKGEQRKFTIDELKVICGYPQDYVLLGNFAQQWERLGRSVPPQMMYRITKQIVKDVLIPIAEYKGLNYKKGPVAG